MSIYISLQGKCLEESIIYRASVTTSTETISYIGQAGNDFKERYYNHTTAFTNKIYRNRTQLSKYIWNLKDKKTPFNLNWSKITTAQTYQPAKGRCNLCAAEKTLILFSKENILNKRTEIMNKCRHRNKHLLGAIT